MHFGVTRSSHHEWLAAMAKKNPRLGSTLESLLREDGGYEEVKNQALKAVSAAALDSTGTTDQ